jgi:amino acid permease
MSAALSSALLENGKSHPSGQFDGSTTASGYPNGSNSASTSESGKGKVETLEIEAHTQGSSFVAFEPGAPPSTVAITLGATAMGCGILSLPMSLAYAGLALGLGLLLLFQIVTGLSLQFLLAAAREAERRTGATEKITVIEELAYVALGPAGARMMNVIMVTKMLGTCIVSIIIMSQFTEKLISRAYPELIGPDNPEAFAMIALLCIVAVFPLTLLEKLSLLKNSSSMVLVAVFFSMLVVVQHFICDIGTAKTTDVELWANPSMAYKAVAIQSFAFTCQYSLLPIMAEMHDADQHKGPVIIHTSLTGVMGIYAVFGALGYLLLGNQVSDNILLSSEFNDVFGMAACVMLLVGNLCKYPIMCVPLYDSLMKFFGVAAIPAGSPGRKRRRFVVMSILSVVVWLTVVLLKNLTAAFTLLGATCGPVISFIFPGLVYAKLVNPITGYAMVMFGLGVGITCLVAFFDSP